MTDWLQTSVVAARLGPVFASSLVARVLGRAGRRGIRLARGAASAAVEIERGVERELARRPPDREFASALALVRRSAIARAALAVARGVDDHVVAHSRAAAWGALARERWRALPVRRRTMLAGLTLLTMVVAHVASLQVVPANAAPLRAVPLWILATAVSLALIFGGTMVDAAREHGDGRGDGRT